MKESQISIMEEFIDNVKILINTLGYKILEPLLQEDENSKIDDEILNIITSPAKANGKVTTEGFVVLKGALVNKKTSVKSLSPGMIKLRERYFADGHVKNLITTEDILFSSSSAAADFVLGYSASGPQMWKTEDGRSLKEIESENMMM